MRNTQRQAIQNAANELDWLIAEAKPRLIRTMRQFAEEEVVLPDGPFANHRFRCDRQPYTRLWLDAVDSGRWNRFVSTGPVQSGKTLLCFVVPIMYHLFEIGENVICGLPDMDMAGDKWRQDLLVVIQRSRYRDLLPRAGGGSRGGRVESITFRNGATLKFMSGGGGDKSRAGFTARVLVVTETDGLDTAGSTSREADKLTQLEARTKAFSNRKRIYMECTVSIDSGRTWQEYQAGTRSAIVIPCPHCDRWVLPEREHFAGWDGAESVAEARNSGRFHCPECAEPWTDEQRGKANEHCQLVHRGQEVTPDGAIVGEPVDTDTLGFRWSAVHNQFITSGDIAVDEWKGSRSADEDNAEKAAKQFMWCIPVSPDRWQDTEIEAGDIQRRQSLYARGVCPPGTETMTTAMDLGKWLNHWVAIAWTKDGRGFIVDYGRIEVASADMDEDAAVLLSMREFRELVQAGWPVADDHSHRIVPTEAWIDSGTYTDTVYAFIRESGSMFRPSKGFGASQMTKSRYSAPRARGKTVRQIGDHFHVAWQRPHRVQLAEVDADYWKARAKRSLQTPPAESGSLVLFQAPFNDHLSFARHVTAERHVQEFVAGKGVVTKHEQIRKNNHWLDALYNAVAASRLAGVSERGDDDPAQDTPTWFQ